MSSLSPSSPQAVSAKTDGAKKAVGRKPSERFPRLPLFLGVSLVLFTIAATGFGQYTEIGTLRVESMKPVAMRDLTFESIDTGEVAVRDSYTGETVAMIEPGAENFVRGTLRGLSRERKRRGAAKDGAYRLIAWDSGELTLSDTLTGQRIYLNGFGETNIKSFARFLDFGSTS